MRIRELDSAPHILPLYARALVPFLPGASRLPFVGGSGGEIPDLELILAAVRVDPVRVADYSRVCGFSLRGELPATYPHVLAFPLHLALMADGRFPFGAIGLVHVANCITQRRPIRLEERLELRVRATPLEAHPRGRTFSLVSEARIADELVWEELSTMLHRDPAPPARHESLEPSSRPVSAEWRLPGELGRRYAAVSGDRNPIHLYALAARPLGFPRAIAHGMWTKARCLAALEELGTHSPEDWVGERLPDAFSIDVRFRRPILLPATVGFGSGAEDAAIRFWVRDAGKDTSYLDGRLRAIGDIAAGGETGQ
jgi:acyl dehydratase